MRITCIVKDGPFIFLIDGCASIFFACCSYCWNLYNRMAFSLDCFCFCNSTASTCECFRSILSTCCCCCDLSAIPCMCMYRLFFTYSYCRIITMLLSISCSISYIICSSSKSCDLTSCTRCFCTEVRLCGILHVIFPSFAPFVAFTACRPAGAAGPSCF